MAKNKKRKFVEVTPDAPRRTIFTAPPSDEPDEDAGDDNQAPELQTFLETYKGQDVHVHIQKLTDDGREWVKIPRITIDQFDEDDVVRQYGGGKYRYRVSNPQGQIIKTVTQTYAQPLKPASGVDPVAVSQDNGITKILEHMSRQNESSQARQDRQFELMINAFGNKSNSIDDILKYKALFDVPEKSNSIASMLEVLKMGMDLKENVATGEPTDVTDSMIKKIGNILLPQLPTILAGMTAKQPPASAQQQQAQIQIQEKPKMKPAVATSPESAPVQEIVFENELEQQSIAVIRQVESMLVFHAGLNTPLPVVINYLVENVPEAVVIMLGKYLENSFERVFNFIPALNPHRDYMKKISDGMIEASREIVASYNSPVKPDDPSQTEDAVIIPHGIPPLQSPQN